jgi:hypothetical protein
LIEEKSILTQELILGGHEMPCEVNLEKNDFSMENNNQLVKDEEFSNEKFTNEKFTNDLTQELKFVGQQMSYDFILGEYQENAKKSMDINKPLDSIFLFEDKTYKNWWMSNQVSIIVFEIEHLLWICGSHNLKILLKWLIKFKNLIIPTNFCYMK